MKQLVDSEDFEEIRMVDFSKVRPGDLGSEDRTWLEELEYSHRELEDSINHVVERYAHVLDPDLIQHLHSLANAGFISLIEIRRKLSDRENADFLQMDIEYNSFSEYLEDLEYVCNETGESFEDHTFYMLHSQNFAPGWGEHCLSDDGRTNEIEDR